MIFDTHCHLFAEQFDEDQDEVIKRANDANVLKMLVLGDKLETSIQSIEISKNMKEYIVLLEYFRVIATD